jgi:ribosome-binding protein aMBF1 (putative translation factor)
MAKYSTGDLGGDSSGACELCGAESTSLETVVVAGAELEVCSDCAKHGERGSGDTEETEQEQDRRRKAAQNAAKIADAREADTNWEEGADYEEDQLPYLVSGYGPIVEEARQDAGLQIEELATELSVDEDDLVAVEQGRAARANVGGSVIEALEERLGIALADE